MIKRVFPVLAISIFAAMLGAGIIIPLIPLYAKSLGATGVWIGIIVAGYSASRAIFMPFVARFSDRTGRKMFLSIGLIFSAIMSLGYIYADSVVQLTVVRLIHGLASAMIVPVAKAYVGELSPKGEEGTWMGYFNTVFFTGIGVGPLMGGFLTEQFSMSFAFMTMGCISLIAFFAVVLFLPRLQLDKGSRKTVSYTVITKSDAVRGILTFQFVDGLARAAFFSFIPIYASIRLGLASTQIGIILAVRVLSSALLQAPFGKLADKIGRKGIVIAGGFTAISYMALTPITQNFGHLAVIASMSGLSSALTAPALSAMAVTEGRKFGMASIMAIVAISISAGMAVGPLLGGILVDTAGLIAVFIVPSALVFLGTVAFIWFTGRPATNGNLYTEPS